MTYFHHLKVYQVFVLRSFTDAFFIHFKLSRCFEMGFKLKCLFVESRSESEDTRQSTDHFLYDHANLLTLILIELQKDTFNN